MTAMVLLAVAIYGAKKVQVARGTGRRAVGLLPSRARLGIYAKLALSFAKLLKMQTLNAKPLDTSFVIFDKLQECKVQMQNRWRCS